jgi:hypothetical protein
MAVDGRAQRGNQLPQLIALVRLYSANNIKKQVKVTLVLLCSAHESLSVTETREENRR